MLGGRGVGGVEFVGGGGGGSWEVGEASALSLGEGIEWEVV